MTVVVVVDSGIDGSHPAVRGRADVVPGPLFGPAGVLAPPAAVDLLGHGTAVAATLLRAPLPRRPTVHAFRVFESTPLCDFGAVLQALAAALRLQPALINLSLGTTSLRHRDELTALVAMARSQSTRIVAPASYAGLPADPGNLPGVEAVVADPNVAPHCPELRPSDGRLLWFASPLPPPDADGVRRLLARGDSLAVASVTGALLRALRP